MDCKYELDVMYGVVHKSNEIEMAEHENAVHVEEVFDTYEEAIEEYNRYVNEKNEFVQLTKIEETIIKESIIE